MREGHQRRPGEAAFMLLLSLASIGLLLKAYGIAGFESLSSPGALPMAAAGTMTAASLVILWKTWRAPRRSGETLAKDVFPFPVVATIAAIAAYAVLLRPLGFILTSFLFLAGLIKVLSGRSLLFCVWVSAASVILIYLVFRIVFTVLMPEGVIPEREILAWIGRLFAGAR
jgi:putative tricarboxylic transport membrane protein